VNAVAREAPLEGACFNHLDVRVTDRHHPHRATGPWAFWLVALTFAILVVGPTVPTPLYVVYQEEWSFSSGTLTLVFAVYTLGVLGALLVFGRLSDEIGRTRVLLGALAVAMASTLVFVFANGVGTLALARFLSGFAAGLTQATATAALAELEPSHDVRRAALVGTAVTSGAVGLGPLLAGVLTEYVGWKTQLVFVVYLFVLAAAVVAVAFVPESVTSRHRPKLRVQRLAVAPEIRAGVFSAALAAFAAFAVTGLFVSLVPSFLGSELHRPNHALAGGIVFLFFASSCLAQIALRRLSPRRVILLGFVGLVLGLGLLMLALSLKALAVFVAGAVAGGVGVGLVLMGGVAIVNQLALPAHRAETLASFFVAGYVGLSLPPIGVGVAAQRIGFFDATLICSIGVAVLLAVSAANLLAGRVRRAAVPA
jgi:MFS family permease